MLQDDEAMVTKKKSKIPCLSLASFLPALEGNAILPTSIRGLVPPVAFTLALKYTHFLESAAVRCTDFVFLKVPPVLCYSF